MIFYKSSYLITKTICKSACHISKVHIGRNIVCDVVEPVLHTPESVLKTKIEGCPACGFHAPHIFALGNPHTKVKHQPRLTYLGSTAKDCNAFRQQSIHTEPHRFKACVH